MTESRTDIVVAYGDSQTAGFSWGNRLPLLSKTINTAIGRGVSGQEAGSVALRQGGIVLSTTAESTIGVDGEPVRVPVSASVTPCNIRHDTSSYAVELAGVRGTARVLDTKDGDAGVTSWNRSTGVGTVEFTPQSAPSSPVTVPSGAVLTSVDVIDHPEWAGDLQIIWVGGNDAAFAGETRVTGVVSAVQSMVDKLRAAVDSPKFLVAGRTTGPTNTEGTSSWQTAVDQRDALLAAFPDNAIDIWGHVRDHGLDILGITPTEEDLAAIAGKTVPPSLTSDGLHYTTATRGRVVAPFIISELAARGWAEPSGEDIPVAEYSPTNWKNKPSTDTPINATRLNNLETGVTSAIEAANAAGQGVTDLRTEIVDKADRSELATLATKTELSGKVDVKGAESKNTVYGIGNGGSLYMYPTGVSTVAAGTVAMRGAGGALRVGSATAGDHAVPKAQMDTALAAKANSADVPTLADFNALAARVAALEAPPSGE